MRVLNTAELTRAGRKNVPPRNALADWLEITESSAWENIHDVRQTFKSADGVPVRVAGIGVVVATVFNIKGNEFRLIAAIDFVSGLVVVKEVLTHAEYGKDAWKGRL
ncbi:MAG: type II toxin-antitoxin system HigB family toxin [Tepidisphaeraceae bacterium]|jgi:mRNA interferase HigB